jgi:predicted GNAT family N-acyltransferase
MPYVIEPLGGQHGRAAFRCGQPDLDDWFRNRAGQDQKRNVARVFVANDAELSVVGFYTLSSYSFAAADLPEDIARKLPRYDAIPAALIGRLARDERVRGKGLGEILLVDAMRRVTATSSALAVFAIVVDAKDDAAATFYERYGFRPFPSRPARLFLPTATAAKALAKLPL